MLNFKIKVMDHISAFRYVYDKSGSETAYVKPFAIISIQEYPLESMGMRYVEGGNLKAALNIHFSDIEREPRTNYPEVRLMKEEDAKKIKEFVEELIKNDEIEELIVHCYAGASRSPAVAAALSKIYNDDDQEYFEECTPNMHVYNMILDAYGFKNDGSSFYLIK